MQSSLMWPTQRSLITADYRTNTQYTSLDANWQLFFLALFGLCFNWTAQSLEQNEGCGKDSLMNTHIKQAPECSLLIWLYLRPLSQQATFSSFRPVLRLIFNCVTPNSDFKFLDVDQSSLSTSVKKHHMSCPQCLISINVNQFSSQSKKKVDK